MTIDLPIIEIAAVFEALSNEKRILLLLNRRFLTQENIARKLGISRTALYKHSKKLGVFERHLREPHQRSSLDDALRNLFKDVCDILEILRFESRPQDLVLKPDELENRHIWLQQNLTRTMRHYENAGKRIARLKTALELCDKMIRSGEQEYPLPIFVQSFKQLDRKSKRKMRFDTRVPRTSRSLKEIGLRSRRKLRLDLLVSQLEVEPLEDLRGLLLDENLVTNYRSHVISRLMHRYELGRTTTREVSRYIT